MDCSGGAGPRLRLICALQESVERTGSGIGGSLLSSRQGSPRTEHGILSTIPASEHFDNPLLTTCAPCLTCAILFSNPLLAWVPCELRRSWLLLIPWYSPFCHGARAFHLHSIWQRVRRSACCQLDLSVPRLNGQAASNEMRSVMNQNDLGPAWFDNVG